MKRSIATTMLLEALLAGGVSACSQTTSSEPPQVKKTDTTSSNVPQTDNVPATERAQQREAMRKQIEAVLTPE